MYIYNYIYMRLQETTQLRADSDHIKAQSLLGIPQLTAASRKPR